MKYTLQIWYHRRCSGSLFSCFLEIRVGCWAVKPVCAFGHLMNPAASQGERRWSTSWSKLVYRPQEADRNQWSQSWWNAVMLKRQMIAPVLKNIMRALTSAARLSGGRQISGAPSISASEIAPSPQRLLPPIFGDKSYHSCQWEPDLIILPSWRRAPPPPAPTLLSVWKPMFLDGSIWVHITQLVIKWKSVPHISSSLKINYLHRS